MDSAELRNALEEAGLSQYQAEAYSTLLQLGAASATEIADACTVPTARIYDVLRDLETKGYIETYEQDSLHARARDPEDVLSDLRGRAELLCEAAEEIEERWQAPEVDPHKVSIVKRFDTVVDRARRLIAEATNEVQVSTTPEQFRDLRPALVEALSNGAVVKVSIHTDPEGSTPPPSETEFAGAVTEARHRTLPTPFVALVDRTYTCFAPHANSLNQYGVLVDDFTLSYVFHWYFTTCLWEAWEPIYSARPEEPPLVYVDLRRCVRDLNPLIDDGAVVRVTVRGFETATRLPVSVEGRVVDVYYGDGPDDPLELSRLAGRVTLTVETDDDVVTVGGWGALIEDVEAIRVTVEAIEEPPTVSHPIDKHE